MKALLIYNPVSGKSINREAHLGKNILELGAGDIEVTAYQMKEKGDGARYLQEEDISRYDMVLAGGGDGTLHEIVDGMLKLSEEKRKLIGYLPAGSTNDYAKNLGINPDNAVDVIINKKIARLDVGEFNGEHFNYVAACGYFTDLPYSTPQDMKNTLGYLAYILEGVKELADMKSYRIRCETDSSIIEDDIVVGVIANTLSVGGVRLKDDLAKLDDGLMEYVFIKYPQNVFDIQNIIFLLMNSRYDPKYMHYGQSKSFKIISDEMAWTLDGEAGGVASLANITTCEKQLEIIVGE